VDVHGRIVPSYAAIDRDSTIPFWRELGGELGIDGIPRRSDSLREWMVDFEQAHYRHTAAGRRLADLLCADWAARWLPPPLRLLGARVPRVLMDEHLRRTHQFAPVSAGERALVARTVHAYFALLRLHPPRHPRYASDRYGVAAAREAAPALG